MDMESKKYIGKVNVDILYVRSTYSDSSDNIDNVYKDEELEISDVKDGWAYVDSKNGWIKIKDDQDELINMTSYEDLVAGKSIEESTSSSSAIANASKTDSTTTTTDTTEKKEDVPTFTTGTEVYTNKTTSSLLSKASLRGIHGMPYQYMSRVDPKVTGSAFGRKYAEKMVANMPMLLMTPGRPKFMKGYSNSDKKSLLKGLVEGNSSTVEDLMQSKNGKFYSFEFNYSEYYKIVNSMCHKVATLMGLGGYILDGKTLSSYDWSNYAAGNDALKAFVTSKETVAFFIDSETQIQETFSNDTGASTLASTVNGLSDMGREVQFLMGGTTGKQFDALKQENYDASMKQLDSFTSKFSNILPDGLMDKLKDGFLTVATGGKMLFPEIWNDSQYSRSYDITLKLRTPDADKYSIFMNLYVPLLHLVALAGAQQLGANSYKSPFLVRAYYKGFFNCEMGIITNLAITKGDKCRWTLDGLPTQIDISLSIKDLYQNMYLTAEDNILASLQNTAELDYLANMCGININKVDIARTIDIYLNSVGQGLKSKITLNHFTDVQQSITNVANNIFRSR